MYKALSASGAKEAALCPGAFALPFDDDEVGFPALRGSFVHKYLEHHASSPFESELFAVRCASDYLRNLVFAIDADGILADARATAMGDVEHELIEQPFAYLDGAVQLLDRVPGKERQYPPDSFGGTGDMVLVTPEHVSVVDYKTGSREVLPDHPQMITLAAFAYLVWARPVTTTIVAIDASHFSNKTKAKVRHSTSSKFWTTDELGGCVEWVANLYSRVREERENAKHGLPVFTNPGEACTYCNSKRHCPSYEAPVKKPKAEKKPRKRKS
jgi:hypothetical protein